MSPYLSDDAVGELVPVTVDGEPVEALAGQTVAGVLMASGRDSWRTTRGAHRPRGVFCGIGICFDCLVVVNELPDVRACQRTIRAGDEIRTQTGVELPGAISGPPVAGPAGRQVDVVVVGAGPGGIAAANSAADAGAEVALVDAGRAVGGQYLRRLAVDSRTRRSETGELHPGVGWLAETSVWAVECRDESRVRLWLQSGEADSLGRQVFPVDARAVVLAPGAYDRVLPFPGWDLPGVHTAGAAQALAKGQRISIGKRVLVAGTGPFLLPVAQSLVGVGAKVVQLLEANQLSTVLRGWSTDPLVARGKLSEAAGYAALLARRRIPFRSGWTVVAAHGKERVEAVTTVRLDREWKPVPGTERDVTVDAVCVGFGFTAQLELAIEAGCALTTGPDGGQAVAVDENQQTSVPGIYAAGELTGIGGAALAAAEGRVAGRAAAGRLVRSADQRKVAQGNRFAKALWRAYPVQPGWQSWSDRETVVCRCEEVTRGVIEDAINQRDAAPGRSLKLISRAGLGLCQGRVCSRPVAALAGQPPPQTDRRPIAVPIRLGDLAGPSTAEEDL